MALARTQGQTWFVHRRISQQKLHATILAKTSFFIAKSPLLRTVLPHLDLIVLKDDISFVSYDLKRTLVLQRADGSRPSSPRPSLCGWQDWVAVGSVSGR